MMKLFLIQLLIVARRETPEKKGMQIVAKRSKIILLL
jgi:hypothetical protein